MIILLLACCSAVKQEPSLKYPKKQSGDSERKAGAAMLFYEQAEKDLDITESVIVTPPKQPKDDKDSK